MIKKCLILFVIVAELKLKHISNLYVQVGAVAKWYRWHNSLTYDKKEIQRQIDKISELVDKSVYEDYHSLDIKIKLLALECLNEIAGKLKDVL